MIGKNAYTREELIACGNGELFGPGNAQLPIDHMLMMDRIVHISSQGGSFDKGEIIAELDINPNLWFFQCHFPGDPVMPAAWDWMRCGSSWDFSWAGAAIRDAAVRWAAAKSNSADRILPTETKVVYHINVKRVIERKLVMGIADGGLSVNGTEIYSAKDLRVGLFKSTESF